ncbi:MAG: uroporphyrinogen-III synthase, partial [Pseudomonadota bacterium]
LADSRRLADVLEPDGIDTLIWPLAKIRPMTPPAPVPPGIQGLLITSAHGIRAFAAADARRDLPVLCVGARSAEVARSLGFGMVLSANGDAASLARLAPGTGIRHFLYPRGREITHDLVAALSTAGQKVTERIVYAADAGGPPSAPVQSALLTGRIDVITLWSARHAGLFATWITKTDQEVSRRATLIAISDRTADAVRDLGFGQIQIADAPDAARMLSAIRNTCEAGPPGADF